MNSTIPQPPSGHVTWRDLHALTAMGERDSTAAEDRIMDLEEALVSRKGRRRLRRKLRGQAKVYAWAASSFRAARLEAYSCELRSEGDR